MAKESAILRKHQPNALVFLVNPCDVEDRAAIARIHRLDEQIIEAGRIVTGP
jgi:hypothetical protein